MKSKHLLGTIFVLIVLFFALAVKNHSAVHPLTANINGGADSTGCSTANIPANGSLSLITEPDAGIQPVLSMIEGATKSIDLVMYELGDQQVEAALAAAEKRGVSVQVLLDGGYQGQPQDENVQAYNFFEANDVPVHWTPKYFTLTHEKSLVIDGAATADGQALIMSFNLTPQYYADDRDFGIVDRNACDIEAMEATFVSDWENTNSSPNGNNGESGTDLVWSPGSSAMLVSLIMGAKTSLDVYNEEMNDADIETALIAAADRGVDVRITMTYSSEWKNAFTKLAAAGAHIRTYSAKASLYIHAKMILVDDEKVFVGSENFSPTSLNKNRELGIVVADLAVMASLEKTFDLDWQNATPFGSGS